MTPEREKLRQKEYHKKYRHTKSGKESHRAANARYAQTEKFKETQQRYKSTSKGQDSSLRGYLKKYDLTVEQYKQMLMLQNGVCAVCGLPPKTKRLAVDHDHATDRVRCLACDTCNKAVIGANTVESARRVLEILESDFDGRKL